MSRVILGNISPFILSIFKRDSFTCKTCGKTPIDCPLVVRLKEERFFDKTDEAIDCLETICCDCDDEWSEDRHIDNHLEQMREYHSLIKPNYIKLEKEIKKLEKFYKDEMAGYNFIDEDKEDKEETE